MAFNYTDIHIFNKNGEELPISLSSAAEIRIPSRYGDPAIFYPVLNSDNELSFYKKTGGTRFSSDSSVLRCTIGDEPGTATVEFGNNYSSTEGSECTINDISSVSALPGNLRFPSVKINSTINFDVISTGLIETESLYVLGYDGNSFDKLSNIDPEFTSRYEILFYIDTRQQNDFRFFSLNNADLSWSNKAILNFNSENDDSYRVNIGFSSEEEGVFAETIKIFLLDRGIDKSLSLNECGIYEIGEIIMNAETVGEDERYRTLFTNFGIPDPLTYNKIFANVPTEEGKTDNILLNQNSKKLFLAYSEIFPYIGTYKALINAVNLLGYNDLYFKEWYKKIGTGLESNYVSYDMSYNSDVRDNIINNAPIEERIHLKKLNWLSMMYKLNEEIYSKPEDSFGFPTVETKYTFNNADLIAKLVSLREWLQKYIIGLNCRIIEVGGEGVYFERFRNNTYGTFQTSLEWNNERRVSPSILNTTNTVLNNEEASIEVTVDPDDSNNRLEDIKDFRFSDFCEGYFDEDAEYHLYTSDVEDSSVLIYTGKTLYCYNDLEEYKIKASVSCDSFLFNNEDFLDSSSCALRIYDNALYVNPLDIANGQIETCVFTNLPILYIKSCALRPIDDIDSSVFVSIKNDDFISVRNLSGAEFSYTEEKKYGLPVFVIKNYDIEKLDASLNNSDEYILDIIEGKLLFEVDSSTYKQITVNFDYTNYRYDKNIFVNIVSFSDFFRVKQYGEVYKFLPRTSYSTFVSDYENNPDEAIQYKFNSEITVNHVGEYRIDVYGFDEQNNIFAAGCKKPVVITAPNYSAYKFAASSSDENEEATAEERELIDNYYDAYCIYNKERDFIFNKTIEDSSLLINYKTYTYSQPTPTKGDYVHFSNKFEKFKLIDIKKLDPATSAQYQGEEVYKSYEILVEREYTNHIYDFIKDPDLDDDTLGEDSNPVFVNVVFYNELGGYPVYQTYARMTSEELNSSIYKIKINDDTPQSYIWASCEEDYLLRTMLYDGYKENEDAENPYKEIIPNYDSVAEIVYRACANDVLNLEEPAKYTDGTTNDNIIKSHIVDAYLETDEETKSNFVEFIKKPYPAANKDDETLWAEGWIDRNYAKTEEVYANIKNGYNVSIQDACEQFWTYGIERSLMSSVFEAVSDFIISNGDASTNTNLLKDFVKNNFVSKGSVFTEKIDNNLSYPALTFSGSNWDNIAMNQVIAAADNFINSLFTDATIIDKDYSDALFAVYSCIAYCVYIYARAQSTITESPFIRKYFQEYIITPEVLNGYAAVVKTSISTYNNEIGVDSNISRVAYIKKAVDNDIASIQTNWITRKVKDTWYYAVAYHKDDTMYYLKPKDALLNGYTSVSPSLPGNFTFDLQKLLSYPGIGIYIEPMYKNIISITAPEDKPGKLEIIPTISEPYNLNMKPGDLLKVYVKNVVNESYIGQASYIIDEINNSDGVDRYIVEGSINDQYIRGNGFNVLAEIEVNTISGDIETGEGIVMVGGIQFDPDTAAFNKIIYYEDENGNEQSAPAYCYKLHDPADGEENVRVWFVLKKNDSDEITNIFYVVMKRVISDGVVTSVVPLKYYTSEISERISMYMSYPQWAYVDYILTANEIKLNNSINTIEFENTLDNKKILTFADSKFLVSVRDFDINKGIKQWMDFSDADNGLEDPLKGTPKISEFTKIYRYDSTNPVLSRDCPYVVIMPKNLPENGYVYWKIYKQNGQSNKSELLFESYNSALYLDSTEPGIYDVEMFVYDRYGNISKNMIKGAYTII